VPNFTQALKTEIVRLSRKEIKSATNPLRSSVVSLKHAVAELKRKVSELESSNKQLQAIYKKEQGKAPQIDPEEIQKARITSRTIRKLREKLGVSQDSFAKLMGMSSQNVYNMEHKEGRLALRQGTLTNLLAVRKMGKRDVQKKLEELKTKKPVKKPAKKKK
jgi:DNA-binding transcriptional regulator YiaG